MLNKLKTFRDRFRYDDSEMPFLEHLEAFRKTLVRSVLALLIGFVICLIFFVKPMVGILRAPAEPYIVKSAGEVMEQAQMAVELPLTPLENGGFQLAGDPGDAVRVENGVSVYRMPVAVVQPEKTAAERGVIRLQFSEPAGPVKMWVMVAFFGGLLLSLPVLVFIIGSFVLPGVKEVERKLLMRISGFSGVLFLVGIWMGYEVTLPLALGIMLDLGAKLGGESIWFYGKYISFSIQLLIGFGLAFQLPVVILILGKMGVVNSTQLREMRPHVVVGLFVLAMLLTPPDVMTQVLMAAPLIVLYEFCIWFLHFSGNRGEEAREKLDI